MKIKTLALSALLLSTASAVASIAVAPNAHAQSMEKKYRVVEVSRTMSHSPQALWQAVAGDYGNIANSHPQIVSSEYQSGSLKGELGAERKCNFDGDNKSWTHERIVGWDEANMVMTNAVITSDNYPLDADNSRAIYSVIPTADGGSTFNLRFEFRTDPAFMGPMVQGKFETLLEQYMVAVDHYLSTGEAVTMENFAEIEKMYQ